MPRLRIEFVQILSDVINDLAGAAKPVEIKLYGSSSAPLEAYAPGARAEGRRGAGRGGPVQRRQRAGRRDEAAREGGGGGARRDGPGAGGAEVSGALLGVAAGEVRLDDRAIAVRVRAPDSVRYDPRRLGALPMVGGGVGAAVPLAALATVTPPKTARN